VTDHRWKRLFQLFEDAVVRPPGERPALLERICADDLELRREVEQMLAAHDAGSGVLDRPPEPLAQAATVIEDGEAESVQDPALGTRIGAYLLVRRIGEGGMGVVYEASQREPLDRRVALKLIELGMDTRELVARFDAERRTLARMDHPNIASVHDAGATPAGRPYFVMELVGGRRIDDDCDERRLAIPDRIRLLTTVCRAVEHAHRRGVLHRDLKPSNILVADEGGVPLPKIIDFGIAKALSEVGGETTLVTRRGSFIGTPEYMSPEQAEGRDDLDTRSDVYSLGVLLYRLVSGVLPFDPERLRSGVGEARRILAEEDAPAPAARLGPDEAGAAEIADRRGTDPRSLRRSLQGELRWILARALARDREGRYGSAAELAADLDRYLSGAPVLAGPPTRRYRFAKFARRHRVALSAAGSILLTLVAGLVAVSIALHQAVLARQEAEQHAAVAQAVSRFLDVDLLGAGKPHAPGDRELTVRDLLERASARLEAGFDGPPIVEAGIRSSLAEAYHGLGDEETSLRHRRRAVELRREVLGPEHPETLDETVELGLTLLSAQQLDEAGELLDRGLPVARRVLGADGRTTLRFLTLSGRIAQARGDLRSAARIFSDVLSKVRRVAPGDDLLLGEATNDLAVVQHRLGDPESVTRMREVYEAFRRHFGDDHDQTAKALFNLAMTMASFGQLEASEPYFRAVLDRQRRIFGADSVQTVETATALSGLQRRLGHLAESRELAEEAYRGIVAARGEETFVSLQVRTNLARVLRAQGDLAGAAAHMKAVVAIARRILGDAHDYTGRFILDFGEIEAQLGHRDEAEKLLLEAHGKLLAALGAGHPFTREARSSLAELYEQAGDHGRAESWQRGEPTSPPS
jgi:eukaryotic-like serine/threonine-protein kinase